MDNSSLSLISAMTALTASVLGPTVTLIVAKTQFRASVLSTNRQRWLESLRDTLAELASQIVGVVIVKKGRMGEWKDGFEAAAADPDVRQRIERIVYLFWRVRLLTKPAHADHDELCRLIGTTLETLKKPGVHEQETHESVERITQLSQQILFNEWERVKRGT